LVPLSIQQKPFLKKRNKLGCIMKTPKEELQERFVGLLRQLTDKGKVEWAQEGKPGYVHCMVGDEHIKFEVLGLDKGHVPADYEKIAYVAGYCHNVTYLWVPFMPDWDSLIELLRQAPVDDGTIGRFDKRTLDLPVKTLERAVADL
jgi:hypothetical protein